MTSIDDLFRKPASSSSAGNKRKLPEPPTHLQSSASKSAKLTTNGNSNTPTFEDDDADVAAGPELPPETDDADADEDEEGRFFGSGVSADTREALDYVEGVVGDDPADEVIDVAWLRKTTLGFERRITRNAELRARFEGEPEKYVGLHFSFFSLLELFACGL